MNKSFFLAERAPERGTQNSKAEKQSAASRQRKVFEVKVSRRTQETHSLDHRLCAGEEDLHADEMLIHVR